MPCYYCDEVNTGIILVHISSDPTFVELASGTKVDSHDKDRGKVLSSILYI
jgi:hypothetical protein